MGRAAGVRHAMKGERGMIAGMMGMQAQFTISDATMALAGEERPEGAG